MSNHDIDHNEELQVLRLLQAQSERLLKTRDELMIGPYQQLHGRICAVISMMVTDQNEMAGMDLAQEQQI